LKKESAYSKAGVNYTEAEILRRAMQEMGKKTLGFPNKKGVFIDKNSIGAHGAIFEYRNGESHKWNLVTETLGNQNWIAEIMYQLTGRSYHEAIGYNFGQIIVYDVLSGGFLPAVFTDAIAAQSYSWGVDDLRRNDFISGLFRVCKDCGMALAAGDSSALKYVVNALPPVKSAPVFIGSIAGICTPAELAINGKKLRPGDHIIGAPSTGIHMNGLSLVINEAMKLEGQFLHELPNGNFIGAEALIPAANYTGLIDAWMKNGVEIHALLAGTGSGLAKIAFDKREYQYHIKQWWEKDEIPPLFQYMGEIGVALKDLLETFNMKGGYYAYVPAEETDYAIEIGEEAGFELLDVGVVEKGERKVVIDPGIFNKEGLTLPPPGG
jgi:phosphoribosylformylglycinamidine cyclo-ligase